MSVKKLLKNNLIYFKVQTQQTGKHQYEAAGQTPDHGYRLANGRYEEGQEKGQAEPRDSLQNPPPPLNGGRSGEQGHFDQKAGDRRPVSIKGVFI